MGNKIRPTIMLLVLSLSATLAYANFDLDVDDDGKTEALTDGLLVIRYLFGFSGESLVAGAVSNNASRSSAADIEAYLKADEVQLDVDGNGEVAALTDGLLIIRSLFGFSGTSLSAGAIAANAARADGAAVATYLEAITDSDNDNTNDAFDAFPSDVTEWLDTDGDSIGNNADLDDDNDGVLDDSDAYKLISLGGLTDTDGDGIPNDCDDACTALNMAADLDDDNDGVLDDNDAYKLISLGGLTDTDGDGRPNDCDSACTTLGLAADADDDNDGVLDDADAFDLDKNETVDTDGDGIGDIADTDDDNDGVSDEVEAGLGTNALNRDSDGDGFDDKTDQLPLNPNENLDTDSDGQGNNADIDDDGDGIADPEDIDPLDRNTPPAFVWGAQNWGAFKWQ